MAASVLSRPTIGDVFVRQNLNGLMDEAAVQCVQYNEKAPSHAWQGVLVTKNGFEFVSGQVEHRNIHDWRPKHWVDDGHGSWVDPAASVLATAAAQAAVIVQHKDGKPVKAQKAAAPAVMLEDLGEPSVGDMLVATTTPKLPSVSIPRV